MKKLKRNWFFWVDKLQITRKERISISIIFFLIVILTAMNLFVEQKQIENTQHYAILKQEFNERTKAMKAREEALAQKYDGIETEIENKNEDANSPKVLSVVNVNTAGLSELLKLDGIGSIYAQRIIDYRTENGPFQSVEELLHIKGIGKKRLEQIRPFITL